MLIDWELTGPDRRFAIQVPDVVQAGLFYSKVLGARETFRQVTPSGEPAEMGLVIGNAGFIISSEGSVEGSDRPLLSELAEALEAPFLAVILRVDNPDRVVRHALKAGGKLMRPLETGDYAIVTDPFGSHWALARGGRAMGQMLSLTQH